MRSIELKIPDIGDADSIELLKWNCREGDSFVAGTELCDLVTDKAAFSLEAPAAGRLQKILIPAASKVRVGQVVAVAEITE